MRIATISVGIQFSFGPAVSEACQACIPYPVASAADRLIDAETVVFARENPDRAFSYVAVDTLKGELPEAEIELFLPSATRRILAFDEAKVAVVLRSATGEWSSLGVADRDYQQVVRRIVAFSAEWTAEEGRSHRVEFFLDLFDHENSSVFKLAYLELGRAPYSTLKRVGGAVSHERLRELLNNRKYMEWRPLAILMLVNSRVEEDRQTIRSAFGAAERFSLTRNLAALTTALIEMDESSAVEMLRDRYVTNCDRTREELVEIARALSVHGTDGHTHLRDQIVECYGELIATHPDLAPMVVSDLVLWERWEFAEQISQIVDSESAGSQDEILGRYLQLAASRAP